MLYAMYLCNTVLALMVLPRYVVLYCTYVILTCYSVYHCLVQGIDYRVQLLTYYAHCVNSHYRPDVVSIESTYQYHDNKANAADAFAREPFGVLVNSANTGGNVAEYLILFKIQKKKLAI